MNMGPREDHSRHSLRAHIRGSAERTPPFVRNRACAETAPVTQRCGRIRSIHLSARFPSRGAGRMNRVRKPRPRTILRMRAARICGSIDIGRGDRSKPCPAQTRPKAGGGAEDHDARGIQARSRPRARATQARLRACVECAFRVLRGPACVPPPPCAWRPRRG